MYGVRPYLHLGEEAVQQVDGVEQHVGRQVVPHLQAAQHVHRAVAGPSGDLSMLLSNTYITNTELMLIGILNR